jgi:hypothetical protein
MAECKAMLRITRGVAFCDLEAGHASPHAAWLPPGATVVWPVAQNELTQVEAEARAEGRPEPEAQRQP